MVGVYSVFRIILCILQVIICRLFFCKLEQPRVKNRLYELGIGFLMMVLLYIRMDMGGDFGIKLASYGVVIFGYAYLTRVMPMYQYFIDTIIYLGVVTIVELVGVALGQLFTQGSVFEQFQQGDVRGIFYAVVCHAILLVLAIWFFRDKGEEFSRFSFALFCTAVMISFFCVYSIVELEENSNYVMNDIEKRYICVLAVSVFAMNVLVYFIIRQLNERLNKEKQWEMIQYKNELLQKAVLCNKEMENEWRKNRHDFNNHLSCIDMLLQMKNIVKARAYIQNLTNSYLDNIPSIDVGDDIANAVLNQKRVLARKNKIELTVEGSLSDYLEISQMDLCAILSNSLDNAIEAVQKIEDTDKRFIHLVFNCNGSCQSIEVDNAVDENVEYKGNKLETTKEDKKHHGIGMASMQMTVAKYKGSLEWKCRDQHFLLKILLPTSAKKKAVL